MTLRDYHSIPPWERKAGNESPIPVSDGTIATYGCPLCGANPKEEHAIGCKHRLAGTQPIIVRYEND